MRILPGLSAGQPRLIFVVMPTATDVLRAKTDAELQFFVDNPGHYHSDLVTAARQELRRRALLPTDPANAEYYPVNEPESIPGKRPLLLLAAAVLALGAAGAGIWWTTRSPAPPPADNLSPAALKLESVETQQLPTYDTAALVAAQLARIPAAEKQNAQRFRQFRELSRRFWAAETQTEFLTTQAEAGQAGRFFTDQTLLVRETWRAWNKAVVYEYHFGPKMQNQFDLMSRVASNQQHILNSLPDLLLNRAFATDKALVTRSAEVQGCLADIRRVSPVTGKVYKATILKFKP